MVLHSNKLLGAPRLRLLRVRNDSCVIPKSFQDTIQVMFFMMFELQLNADCLHIVHLRYSKYFMLILIKVCYDNYVEDIEDKNGYQPNYMRFTTRDA